VTFSLPPAVSVTPEEFVTQARAAGVSVSARATAGVAGVRVGCHADNTVADLDALLEVVDACRG
jgi:selenocysteine lyase/cysteine desulfurase